MAHLLRPSKSPADIVILKARLEAAVKRARVLQTEMAKLLAERGAPPYAGRMFPDSPAGTEPRETRNSIGGE